MIIEGPCFSYNEYEKQFIKYFNRLYEIGVPMHEIRKINIPQLQKYYDDTVVPHHDFVDMFRNKTLQSLFDEWSNYKSWKPYN